MDKIFRNLSSVPGSAADSFVMLGKSFTVSLRLVNGRVRNRTENILAACPVPLLRYGEHEEGEEN